MNNNAIDIQWKKGVVEMLILNFLSKKDYYTYELNKEIGNFIEINESTAYAIFKKLINKGWCEYYLRESDFGPARKYYKITNKGKKELIDMIKTWHEFTESITDIMKGN